MKTYHVGLELGTGRVKCVVYDESGTARAIVYDGAMDANLIAAASELLESLIELFEHCAMINKYGGEISNQKEERK